MNGFYIDHGSHRKLNREISVMDTVEILLGNLLAWCRVQAGGDLGMGFEVVRL